MATKAENTTTLCGNGQCNHPRSFHRSGKTRCHVIGCRCTRWSKTAVKAKKAPLQAATG